VKGEGCDALGWQFETFCVKYRFEVRGDEGVWRKQNPSLVHQIGKRNLATIGPRAACTSHDEVLVFAQHFCGYIVVRKGAQQGSDGYTLVMVSGSFVINPSLYPNNTPFDPVKDFAPITMVVTSSHVLLVHPSVPVQTVKDLVALIRANPGKYSYASPGKGQSGQLAAELFKLSTGLGDVVHIPFNGAAPAIVSTTAGHTPIAFVALPAAASNIHDGQLRALAITDNKRSAAFPQVPTMAEAGFPDQESLFPMGLLAPAGTSKEIVDFWYREIAKIVALPDVKERLTALGFEPVANTPEEFASSIGKEVPRWATVIRDAHID
jgi:tripartite-type tricarboxylate transporter receptor subunit TctC